MPRSRTLWVTFVKQTSEQLPECLVELLFSFRGVSEVDVPADRIHVDK